MWYFLKSMTSRENACHIHAREDEQTNISWIKVNIPGETFIFYTLATCLHFTTFSCYLIINVYKSALCYISERKTI